MDHRSIKISIGISVFLVIFAPLFASNNNAAIASGQEQKVIINVLNNFHESAAKADETRYMDHLAKGAIFLGTDADERWSKEEFQKYVHRFFSKGRGWTYVGKDRLIKLDATRNFAWFSERLFNEKYGELRGSGVLGKVNGQWKIFQYNLVFVVPNSVAGDVVKRIQLFQKTQQKIPSTQP